MQTPEVIVAALIALVVLGALLAVHGRRRSKRHSQDDGADRSSPNKFETTLGEFHDIREALRPLQHARAAPRSVFWPATLTTEGDSLLPAGGKGGGWVGNRRPPPHQG